MDFNELIEDNSEKFVRDLKIAFFDIAARNQIVMDQIELALSHETNLDRIDSLQRLWADYHDSVKGCINGIYLACTSLKQLQECSKSYESLVSSKNVSTPAIAKEEPKIADVTNMIQDAVSNVPVDAIVEAPIEKVQEEPTFTPITEQSTLVTPQIEKEPVDALHEVIPEYDAPVKVEEASLPPVETTVEEEIPQTVEAINPIEVGPQMEESSLPNDNPVVIEEPKLISSEAFAPVNTNIVEEVPKIIVEEPKVENVESNLEEPTVVPSEKIDSSIENKEISVEESPVIDSSYQEENLPKITAVKEDANPTVEVKEEKSESNEEVVIPSVEVKNVTEETATNEVEKEDSTAITKIEVVDSPTLEEDIPVQDQVPLEKEETQEANETVEEKDSVVLPVIEEKKEEQPALEKKPEDQSEEHSNEENNKGILELVPEPEGKTEIEKDLKVFVKDSYDETKAILVTKTQAQKLRYSKDLQSTLFNSIHTASDLESSSQVADENVTEEELERMISQLSTLYEQGKMEEAEIMSDKISVLSKKLNPAA